MINKCPGHDDRNLKSEIMVCPDCGFQIEIFSDEIQVRCPQCGKLACRQRLPSCVDWCKSAKDCLGEEKWRKLKGG